MIARTFLEGPHPTHGRLVACIDPGTREAPEKAAVAHSRLAAHLHPFASEAAAREALLAAGATIEGDQR